MATRPDAPDLAVDELRRKARRRLVGAVVLALAAAVLLPLLLENEPKPLGDDVSIQIPPVDAGKFVNPLSPAAPTDGKAKSDKGSTAGSESSSMATPSPPPSESAKTEAAKTETAKTETAKTESAKAETPKSETRAPDTAMAPPSAKAAAGAGAAETASPEAKPAAPPPEPKSEMKPATRAEARSEPAKAAGPFVVQVAAFSDRYGARSLVSKLKQGGFPGYTETVSTDKGTLHRVRVGPYSSREAADAARTKLKAAGFDGVVARKG
ncbi:MAG TPA: SPOR domain-containing protein [Casimicrobiaceae bacterium]|nr:SPOR domain-containing protein [Casimicrobiaceae bacterium]